MAKVTAPTTPTTNFDSTTKFAPRADMILVVSCTNTNPNGDPNAEGRPREDIYGNSYISSESIKDKIRSTVRDFCADPEVDAFKGVEDRNKIFVERGTIRTEQIKDSVDLTNRPALKANLCAKDKQSDKKGCNVVSREDRNYVAGQLCQKFFDVRAYGQVLGNIGSVHGAVQIEDAYSLNKVDFDNMGITVGQVANGAEAETKDRTMGNHDFIKFGIYPIYIHVNGIRSKLNGFTLEDYNNMKEILMKMWDHTNSRVRTVQFENLFVFEHQNITGSMPMKALRKVLDVSFKSDRPTSPFDIEVKVKEDILSQYPGIKFYEA